MKNSCHLVSKTTSGLFLQPTALHIIEQPTKKWPPPPPHEGYALNVSEESGNNEKMYVCGKREKF